MQIAHITCRAVDILNHDVNRGQSILFAGLRDAFLIKDGNVLSILRYMTEDITIELYAWGNQVITDIPNCPYMRYYTTKPFIGQYKCIRTIRLSEYKHVTINAIVHAFYAKKFRPSLIQILDMAPGESAAYMHSCVVIEPKKATFYCGPDCEDIAKKRLQMLTFLPRSPKNEHWAFDKGSEACYFNDIRLTEIPLSCEPVSEFV